MARACRGGRHATFPRAGSLAASGSANQSPRPAPAMTPACSRPRIRSSVYPSRLSSDANGRCNVRDLTQRWMVQSKHGLARYHLLVY